VAIGLDSMLEAVELPARVSDLTSGLADVYGDALTLGKKGYGGDEGRRSWAFFISKLRSDFKTRYGG